MMVRMGIDTNHSPAASGQQEPKLEEPKRANWRREMLQKILANITIQINNLVLKYEQDDIVLSLALGCLDAFSADQEKNWVKCFQEPNGPSQLICKRIDMRDVTIFMDRYTSDRKYSDKKLHEIHRKVVGYEVPVLNRTTISGRLRIALNPRLVQEENTLNLAELYEKSSATREQTLWKGKLDFNLRPSKAKDPFAQSEVSWMKSIVEIDVSVKELAFSLSDRQLVMIAQVIFRKKHKHRAGSSFYDLGRLESPISDPVVVQPKQIRDFQNGSSRGIRRIDTNQAGDLNPEPSQTSQQSKVIRKEDQEPQGWFGWAMSVLGSDDVDPLVDEILSEAQADMIPLHELETQPTRASPDPINPDTIIDFPDEAVSEKDEEGDSLFTLSFRAFLKVASLTIRKHVEPRPGAVGDNDSTVDPRSSHPVDDENAYEELIPVANVGLVRVPKQVEKRTKVSKPAVPICTLTFSNSAVELGLCSSDIEMMSLMLEIEQVQLSSVHSDNAFSSVMSWGTLRHGHDDCSETRELRHPYYRNSLFNEHEEQGMDEPAIPSDPIAPLLCDCHITEDLCHLPSLQELSKLSWSVSSKVIALIERTGNRAFTSQMCSHLLYVLQEESKKSIGLWLVRDIVETSIEECLLTLDETLSEEANLSTSLQEKILMILAQHVGHTCNTAYPRFGIETKRISSSAARMRFFQISKKTKLRVSDVQSTTSDLDDVGNEESATVFGRQILDIAFGTAQVHLKICTVAEIYNVLSLLVKDPDPVNSSNDAKAPADDNDSDHGSTQVVVERLVTFPSCFACLHEDDSPTNPTARRVLQLDLNGFAWWQNDELESRDQEFCLNKGRLWLTVPALSPASKTQTTMSDLLILDTAGLRVVICSKSTNGQFCVMGGRLTGIGELMRIHEAYRLVYLLCRAFNVSIRPDAPEALHGDHTPTQMALHVNLLQAFFSLKVDRTDQDRVTLETTVGSLCGSVGNHRNAGDHSNIVVSAGSIWKEKAREVVVSPHLCSIRTEFVVRSDHLGLLPFDYAWLLLGLSSVADTCPSDYCALFVAIELHLSSCNINWKHLCEVNGLIERLLNVFTATSNENDVRESIADESVLVASNNTSSLASPLPVTWNVTVNVGFDGGVVHLNRFVKLTLPRIVVKSSTVELMNPFSLRDQYNGGGGRVELHYELSTCCLDVDAAFDHDDQSRICQVDGVKGSITISTVYPNVDTQLLMVDFKVVIQSIDLFISRFKLLWLSRIPIMASISSPNASSSKRQATHVQHYTSRHQLWEFVVGGTVERVYGKFIGDMMHVEKERRQTVPISIILGVQDIGGAFRAGSGAPFEDLSEQTCSTGSNVDLQLHLRDLYVFEKVHELVRHGTAQMAKDTWDAVATVRSRSRFGAFISMTRSNFVAVLLCLDVQELSKVAQACHCELPESVLKQPSAIASWQITSKLSATFLDSKEHNKPHLGGHREPMNSSRADSNVEHFRLCDAEDDTAGAIPILVSANTWKQEDPDKSTPLIRLFYRMYEDRHRRREPSSHVVAASIESCDFVVSPSLLLCFSSLIRPSEQPLSDDKRPASVSQPPQARSKPIDQEENSIRLDLVQMSIGIGRVRVIFRDPLLAQKLWTSNTKDLPEQSNVAICVENSFVESRNWTDIDLKGLGYPPFNSAKLPRRARISNLVYGGTTSQRKMMGRVGKLFIASCQWIDKPSTSGDHEPISPFEGVFGLIASRSIQNDVKEVILAPMAFSCDLLEKNQLADPAIQREVLEWSIHVTRLNVSLAKDTFQPLKLQVGQLALAFHSVVDSVGQLRSIQQRSSISIDAIDHPPMTEKQCSSPRIGFSGVLDGVELTLLSDEWSLHARIGSVCIVQESLSTSGSLVLQNAVLGRRSTLTNTSCEELLFGPFSDPSQWQFNVESYSERLVRAKWSLPTSKADGTALVEVQSFQTHVPVRLFSDLIDFVGDENPLPLQDRMVGSTLCRKESGSLLHRSQPFTFSGRIVAKLLVAPSVLSVWALLYEDNCQLEQSRNLRETQTVRAWLSLGEMFGTVTCGNSYDEYLHFLKCYASLGVHELNKHWRAQTTGFVLNVDKLNGKISQQTPILAMELPHLSQFGSLTKISWDSFITQLCADAPHLEFLEDCGICLTGNEHQVVEVVIDHQRPIALRTPHSRVSFQADLNALKFRINAPATQSFLVLREAISQSQKIKQVDSQCLRSPTNQSTTDVEPDYNRLSTDDLNNLKRITEIRLPSPGELIFYESLAIETTSNLEEKATCSSNIDPGIYVRGAVDEDCAEPWDDGVVDIRSLLEEINLPWKTEDANASATRSWMVMRWCYCLPRRVSVICINPVPIPPIPPSGLPNGWPMIDVPDGNEDVEIPCDILCELRCWDHRRGCFVVVCEFSVPWERNRSSESPFQSPRSFGDLVSQWFDEDEEVVNDRASKLHTLHRLLQSVRYVEVNNAPASETWELRWRAPLCSEADSLNLQRRLLVTSLLASSLQIKSSLCTASYSLLDGVLVVPETIVSISHMSGFAHSHDVLSLRLSNTIARCMGLGNNQNLDLALSTVVSAQTESIVQLLTVPLVPRTSLHLMMTMGDQGMDISAVSGPMDIFVNHTSALMLMSLPAMLFSPQLLECSRTSGCDDSRSLAEMRLLIRNELDTECWFRQDQTSECLHLHANSEVAYSWLTLKRSLSFCRMQFALHAPKEPQTSEVPSMWCEACEIRSNSVQGRFFAEKGFMWVIVELCGLQTLVTLRASATIINQLPVVIKCRLDDREVQVAPKPIREQAVQDHVHNMCTFLDKDQCSLHSVDDDKENRTSVMTTKCSTLQLAVGEHKGSHASNSILIDLTSIPLPFELLKSPATDSEQSNALSRGVILRMICLPSSPCNLFVWSLTRRIGCNMQVMTEATDQDQPMATRRYAWLETSVWPALRLVNQLNKPIRGRLVQHEKHSGETTEVEIHLQSHEQRAVMSINPETLMRLDVANASSNSDEMKYDGFDIPVPVLNDLQKLEETFVCQDFCVFVGSRDRMLDPTIEIRFEQALRVRNGTSEDLEVKVLGIKPEESFYRALASKEQVFVADVAVPRQRIKLLIGAGGVAMDSSHRKQPSAEPQRAPRLGVFWSSPMDLSIEGDENECVVVVQDACDITKCMAKVFWVTLTKNANGRADIVIHPRVIVLNSTPFDLQFAPTDLFGGMLLDETQTKASRHHGDAWSVPAFLERVVPTQASPSWFARRVLRRKDEGPATPRTSSAQLTVNLSAPTCSFAVSIVDKEYAWSDPVVVNLKGKTDKSLSTPRSSGTDASIQPDSSTPQKSEGDNVQYYAAPSSLTRRKRLLVRHSQFFHKMLSYCVTFHENSICVNFFCDLQPPVILFNGWSQPLAFQSVSTKAASEMIGPQYQLEYDWAIQLTRRRSSTASVVSSIPSTANPLTISAIGDEENSSSESSTLRFVVGNESLGWSSILWQVEGIQFASFEDSRAVFLVTTSFWAGTWHTEFDCVEEPTGIQIQSPTALYDKQPELSLSSSSFQRLSIHVDNIIIHFCDEFQPGVVANQHDKTDATQFAFPELFRLSLRKIVVLYLNDGSKAPEALRNRHRLGYLNHVLSFGTLYCSIMDLEISHFIATCDFPVMVCFPHCADQVDKIAVDVIQIHDELQHVMNRLLDRTLPNTENGNAIVARLVLVQTKPEAVIPAYFHSIELQLAEMAIEIEDGIAFYAQTVFNPLLEALSGLSTSSQVLSATPSDTTNMSNRWRAMSICAQPKIFIDRLLISEITVSITARTSLPVLSNLDGTPLSFASTDMQNIFAFGDQLVKDLAANFVADTIVRSPLLLMSLGILGNPAGFFRNVGVGVRDLFVMPFEAGARDGYNPWTLTKGILYGTSSLLRHTSVAALTSLSAFSYTVSSTMDQLTLPANQARKRRYARPSQLSSALANGLESLGSSVLGAATGVVTTPLAIYEERRLQGRELGFGDVVGGVGKGLVGVLTQPMSGMASLVALTSDGILYGSGMEWRRVPADLTTFDFVAHANEVLRYKLKVLRGVHGSIAFAHGLWVDPAEELVEQIKSEEISNAPDAVQVELKQSVLVSADAGRNSVAVTAIVSRQSLFIVGTPSTALDDDRRVVLMSTSLLAIHGIEETLTQPTRLELGVKRHDQTSLEWLKLRFPVHQRRHFSHMLRTWVAEAKNY